MDNDERIAQWQKMTQEAPDDMAWFSLGGAYKDAGRLDEAADAFRQAVGLNPGMSRAYQEGGEALVVLDRPQEATEMLCEGYRVADRRGDRAVQQAIVSLLERLGQPVPVSVAGTQDRTAAGGDGFVDRRTGQPGTRMTEPPMRGPLGEFIRDHYTQETWRQWIGQGTKVINELRLDFSKPEHQEIYEQQMKQWLEISDEDLKVNTSCDR